MGGGPDLFPFGDGILCVAEGAAAICRFDVRSGGGEGIFVEGPGIVAFTQPLEVDCRIDPGDTWHFQGWYRDPLGPCGSFFNFSNAVSVTFGP